MTKPSVRGLLIISYCVPLYLNRSSAFVSNRQLLVDAIRNTVFHARVQRLQEGQHLHSRQKTKLSIFLHFTFALECTLHESIH